jgi:hypothetical protein
MPFSVKCRLASNAVEACIDDTRPSLLIIALTCMVVLAVLFGILGLLLVSSSASQAP